MSTTKITVFAYLTDRGFENFTIKKRGDFIDVCLWDDVTFERVEELKIGLNEICGKLSDPKFSWIERLNFHCGNVRFK